MDALNVIRLVLLFGHIIGISLLFGGFAVQALAKQYRINSAMVYGAVTQIVTGLALSAPLRDGDEPSPAKLAVKLVIAIFIAAMVIVVRSKESVAKGHFFAIGGMTLLNIAVALFWTSAS